MDHKTPVVWLRPEDEILNWKTQQDQLKALIEPSVWRRRCQKVVGYLVALVNRPICSVFHRKNHMCWDTLWWEKDAIALPGNLCWVCNTCKRSWNTRNPRLFESELNPGPVIWGEYAAKVFMVRKAKRRKEAFVRNKYIRSKQDAEANHK